MLANSPNPVRMNIRKFANFFLYHIDAHSNSLFRNLARLILEPIYPSRSHFPLIPKSILKLRFCQPRRQPSYQQLESRSGRPWCPFRSSRMVIVTVAVVVVSLCCCCRDLEDSSTRSSCCRLHDEITDGNHR